MKKNQDDKIYQTIKAMLWHEVNKTTNQSHNVIIHTNKKYKCCNSCIHCMRGCPIQVIKNEDMDHYLSEQNKKQERLVFFTSGLEDRKRFFFQEYSLHN